MDRAGYVYLGLNLVLYFVLPISTPSAKVLNIRHAVLAALLLPLLAHAGDPVEISDPDDKARFPSPGLVRLLVLLLAGAALLNGWIHLWLFDREARDFDAILAAAPARPRVVELNRDPYGEIMANLPYSHFDAYLQAEKGGLIAETFPRAFWNLPVGFREELGLPATPFNFGVAPELFNDRAFGFSYDHALVRGNRVFAPSVGFPFELVLRSGSWQLYRRVPKGTVLYSPAKQ